MMNLLHKKMKYTLLCILFVLMNLGTIRGEELSLGNWKADTKAYRPIPIMYIHGFLLGNPRGWGTAMNRLQPYFNPYYEEGSYQWAIDLSDDLLGSVDGEGGWANRVNGYINIILSRQRYADKVIIVAHSMGGLAARECIRAYNASDKVERLITVGTPHLGSPWADFGKGVAKAAGYKDPRGFCLRILLSYSDSVKFPILDLTQKGAGMFLELAERIGGSEAAKDLAMEDNPFLNNLNKAEPLGVDYFVFHGNKRGLLNWLILGNVKDGDGVVPCFSQRGDGVLKLKEPAFEIEASHFSCGPIGAPDECTLMPKTKKFLEFIDYTTPEVKIVSPSEEPYYETSEKEIKLGVTVGKEYLPATCIPVVTIVGPTDGWETEGVPVILPNKTWYTDHSQPEAGFILPITFKKPGEYKITANVTNPAGKSGEDIITVKVTERVDLRITKSGERAVQGLPKTYYIHFWNSGGVDAHNVKVIDTLPPRVEYLSSSLGGVYSGGVVTWDIDTLSAGSIKLLTVRVKVPPTVPRGTILKNTVSISSDEEDLNLNDNEYIETEEVTGAVDPNDKLVSPQGYIQNDQLLNYVIRFENLAGADADAVYVTITDELDEDLDWTTLAPGIIQVGTETYTIDNYNRGTLTYSFKDGTITWHFEEINLPPNETPPEGKGAVLFSIKPKKDLPSGREIKNKAINNFNLGGDIVPTPEVCNTIDVTKPTSTVNALSQYQTSTTFEVSWFGTDTHSGIKNYTIYVSDNWGAYILLATNTTVTSTIFAGEYEHTYRFYSIAEDNIGNIENPPDEPDATTSINPPPTLTNIAPNTEMNTKTIDAWITGTGFLNEATVKLVKEGESDIIGQEPFVFSSTEMIATFDLTGAKAGKRNVIITNPDSQIGSLTSGFTILGPCHHIKIEDQAGNELGIKNIPPNGTLTFYLKGYDANQTLISYIPSTWTLLGNIGTLSSTFGTSTVFYATSTGIGTITAFDGTNTAFATIIVGNQIDTTTSYIATLTTTWGTATIKTGTNTEALYFLPPEPATGTILAKLPKGNIRIGIVINAYGTSGNLFKGTLSNPINIEIHYNEIQLGNIDEDTLALYISSDNGNTWQTMTYTLDKTQNIIYGTFNHLSIIAPAGKIKQVASSDLTNAFAYPNPCKQYPKITFRNLTEQCIIRIYNIAGELVFEQEYTNTNGIVDWNLKNKNGKPVASGVYIYVITNNQKQKPAIGKIGIIK